jgi:hypothetical protein
MSSEPDKETGKGSQMLDQVDSRQPFTLVALYRALSFSPENKGRVPILRALCEGWDNTALHPRPFPHILLIRPFAKSAKDGAAERWLIPGARAALGGKMVQCG